MTTTNIWRKPISTETLPDFNTRFTKNTLMETLSIQISKVGPDFLEATMPVDSRTHQPFGLLHGGASAALAESVGSFAAYLAAEDGKSIVGVDINTSHLRGVKSGSVTARATPIRLGSTLQVWEIKTFETAKEEEGLVSHSKHTVMVRDSVKRPKSG
jgi:1,4-dihydroxy-2-naphthoyl-CoA hydrolase